MDFTYIPTDVCESLLQLKFDYDENRETRAQSRAFYRKERARSEVTFLKWLEESNTKLVETVGECIAQTFNNHKTLFELTPTIWGASVVLGIQTSDNPATIDMIELTFRETVRNITVIRILPDLITRNQILTFLDQISRNSQKLLVIVEQTEKMQVSLLELLIRYLSDMLKRSDVARVMVLFCMTNSYMNLDSILPLAEIKRIGRKDMIIKDIGENAEKRIEMLLSGIGNFFQLSARILDIFSNHTCFVDRSVMYLKYLYQYAMFEHYILNNAQSNTHILNCDKIATQPSKRVESRAKPSRKSRSSNKTQHVVEFDYPKSKTAHLIYYHNYISQQLNFYFILLRDETGRSFPASILELYLEVSRFEDLSCSQYTIDAIFKLKSYSVQAIIRRIDQMGSLAVDPLSSDMFPNIYKTLLNFKEKLENNEDCDEIRRELQEKLVQHIRYLKNPLNDSLSSTFYYIDYRNFEKRTMPALRFDFSALPSTSNFGLLYEKICCNPEEISELDLFDEFKRALKDHKSNYRKSVVTPYVKMKMTPRRTRHSVQPKQVYNESNDVQSKKEKLEEQEQMAIFADLIDCMHHQGIVERELRRSKRGIIKRSIWPPLTEDHLQ